MKRLSRKKTTSVAAVGSDGSAAQRIVAAARRHFFAHGIRSVTMDDLAAELGMSKKTLYAAFPGKRDVLRAVLLEKFRGVETDLEQAMSGASDDVLGALHKLLACMRHHTDEIQPSFVRDIQREAPEFFKLIEDRRRRLIQRYFGSLFEAGQSAGIIREDIATRLMIEMLVGVTEAIMNPPKMAELGLTPRAGYISVITVMLEGLLTEKGRAEKAAGVDRL
jgi:TetR/AcrR family transcriptional regulator, cholesterol catabolism regulator